jgi:hypothetical protein
MKTNDFQPALTSSQLQENIFRQFGTKIALEKYDRERLENVRNLLRTKVDQTEKSAGVNDLLTNETYQKDKAMLQLLNTRIKEMLGEDIKTLRDKLDAINEGKKSMKDPIRTKKAKGPMADKDYDGDGKIETNKDEVWGSRAKAAAKSGKPFNESGEAEIDADLKSRGGDQDTKSNFNKQETKPGVTRYTKKSSTFTSEPHKEKASTARTKADTQARHDDEAERAKYKGLRQVRKGGETQYFYNGEEITQAQYEKQRRLNALGVKENAGGKTCNETPKGKRCPVHGLQECGMGVYEGQDEGKPGKNFAKISKDAGKRYGSKEAGERVAGAVRNKLKKQGKLEEAHQIFKRHVKIVNESLAYLLSENEEDKAKAITAAGDIVNDYTSWMQRVGQYQTKSMIELSDSIRGDFGVQQAEAFKNAVAPALAATLEVLTAQREAISNAVAVLAGEQIPETPMGAEPGMEPGMDMAGPDMMNEPAGDEFGAADAAAGAGTPGREMRESASQRRARRLAESHSIISKLAR